MPVTAYKSSRRDEEYSSGDIKQSVDKVMKYERIRLRSKLVFVLHFRTSRVSYTSREPLRYDEGKEPHCDNDYQRGRREHIGHGAKPQNLEASRRVCILTGSGECLPTVDVKSS